MDSYELYFLNPKGNHIRRFREFEAEHDFAALVEAERLRGDGPMELWCHNRKVEKWLAPSHDRNERNADISLTSFNSSAAPAVATEAGWK